MEEIKEEQEEIAVVQEEGTQEEQGCENAQEQVQKQTFGKMALDYLKKLPKRWFITAFSGMAQGLFVTLIAGTILAQIAGWIGTGNYFGKTLNYIANVAKSLMGAGIGVGIAHALGKNKLLIFAAAVAGFIGALADKLMIDGTGLTTLTFGAPGNPIGAYVVTMLVVELVSIYAGKTKLDIILIPIGGMLIAFMGIFVSFPFIWLVNQLGELIALATHAVPFVMGVVVSVSMGILLTMPTSSAAIWLSIATPVITGFAAGTVKAETYNAILLAGGAATVGCACHMVGFAVASFRENKISGLISQGIGTSMLQIPNIMKKPVIMLPMVISSAVLGPLSTCVFALKCGASGGGMGTSGLVGVFDLFEHTTGALGIVGIVLLMFVLPIILNVVLSELFRKLGWIKFGDMKLQD